MYFVYNLIYTIIFILIFPYLILRGLLGRHGVLERLGKISVSKKLPPPRIWFHTASVGEVKALAVILPKLKKLKPDFSIAVSVMTKTGKRQARESLTQADLIFYFPLDFPGIMKKVLKKLNPSLLVLVETELWPNLIRESKKYGCKLSLINGRLSQRSFRRYHRIKSFSRLVLSHFDQFLIQSSEDAKRFRELGADESKTKIIGNLKFDRIISGINGLDKVNLRKKLRLLSEDRLMIAGSTHPEEERIILSAFRRLREKHKELVLLLAPRHLSHLSEIEEILSEFNLTYIKKSLIGKFKKAEAILLDTMGELERFYSIGELAFVGGSLIPVGGHNILEPASYGIPVLFGPHIENFKAASDLLLKSGAGIMVKDEEELYQNIDLLLKDGNLRQELGKRGKEALSSRTGISDETVQLLLKLLPDNAKDEKR
jgi:3-deoxy-D-manno-octulosonic-acid transferase